MATYNWSYRPNVPNRYGFIPQDTPDDVKPNNLTYVALYGNDITGNGSRERPFRSINKGISYGNPVVIASGVYREHIYGNSVLIGDGDVRLEALFYRIGAGIQYFHVEVNTVYPIDYSGGFVVDSKFKCGRFPFGGGNMRGNILNAQGSYFGVRVSDYSMTDRGNNTFVNSQIVFDDQGAAGGRVYGMCANSIFYKCDILIQYNVSFDYSLFYQCRFTNNGIDFLTFNSKEEFIGWYKAIYPDNTGFTHCFFGDPKFNNPEIEDYSLAFDSPAKNLSYIGTYVGAKSIGYPIKARINEVDGGFDFSTKVNLSILDNSITLTNPELDASIESKVISNIKSRELAEAPIFGFNADRNGQYIDSIPDLADVTLGVGDNLQPNTPYLVAVSAITYDGEIVQPGERFTTKNILTFTSEGNGNCREIIEAPQRHTILARFSNGGNVKTVGDALNIGFWYYVTGTITYNEVIYTNQTFKAVDNNVFSGDGVVIEAMTNQIYQHYEPGIKFTSNNVGDVRTGEILRGNGDPEYVRGIGFEFPINARFIQVKYIIRVNNLKP